MVASPTKPATRAIIEAQIKDRPEPTAVYLAATGALFTVCGVSARISGSDTLGAIDGMAEEIRATL